MRNEDVETQPMILRVYIALLLLFVPTGVRSNEVCPKPKTVKDVLECVLKANPATERARLAVELSQTSEAAAARLPNPSLSLQSGILSPSGQGGSDHQISLTQPIDLAGQCASRVREAQATTGKRAADQDGIRADLAVQSLRSLNRLRQLTLETRLITETERTFVKLIALFKSRPSLTPEQETAYALFRTAQSELELKMLSATEETMAIESYFALAGVGAEDLRAVLPSSAPAWASLTPESPLASPARKRAEAELDLAVAELDTQKAASWPALAAGPYAQIQNDGTSRRSLFGVALTLEIPILSLNHAGRASARKGVLVAERNKELVKKEEALERARLFDSYTRSVGALRKLPTLAEQEKAHQRLEKLFVRGIVPSSLVIESHRQTLEHLRSRHEREEKALEAMWKLMVLEGRISEATL